MRENNEGEQWENNEGEQWDNNEGEQWENKEGEGSIQDDQINGFVPLTDRRHGERGWRW